MNFLKNNRRLTLFLVSVSMMLIPLFIYGCGSKSSKKDKNVKGFAYVFTNDGVNVIDIRNNTVKEQWEGIARSSWPDNVYNEGRRVIWGNFGQGVFALDTQTRSVTEILTGSTSGNWAVQTPDGKEVYVAARKPRQAYLLIDGDPDSATYATELASIPIPFIPSRLKPGQLGPGPCDAAMTTDGKHIWEPDIWHDTLTRVDTSLAAGGFGIGIQYFMDRLVGPTVRIEPFMSTVSLDNKYVLIENLSRPDGTESVIDITDPDNPQEVVRFVQSSLFSTMPRGGSFVEYISTTPPLTGKLVFLDTTTGAEIEIKGGLGSGPRSDEFTKDNKYSLIINRVSDDVNVVEMATLSIICTVALPSGSGASTGDWSVDGVEFLVNLQGNDGVGVIKYDDSAVGCAKFTYLKTISLLGTAPQGIVVKTVDAN